MVHGLGENSHPPGLLHDQVHMGSCWPFPAVLPAPTHSALFHFIAFVGTCDYSFHFHPQELHFHEEILLLPCPHYIFNLCTKLNKYLPNCVYKKKMLLNFLKRPLGLFLFVCVHKMPSDWVWETYWKFWTLLGIRGLLQLLPPKQTEKHNKEKWKKFIWYHCVLEQETVSYIKIKFSPLKEKLFACLYKSWNNFFLKSCT